MKKIILIIPLILLIACDEEASNNAPVFVLLEANPESVMPEEIVELSCLATDADGDDLTYWWSSDTGEFIGSIMSNNATWKAPLYDGSYSVEAHVSDGKETIIGSISFLISLYPAQEGRDFANAHFDENIYRWEEFILASSPTWGDSGAYTGGTIDDWTALPWDTKIHYLPHEGFTHELPTQSERDANWNDDQQYYEMIGKYIHQFGFGWDDMYGDDPGTPYFDGSSPRAEYYAETWLRP